MKSFESYFNENEIVQLLCKIRIRNAKQRHKVHLLTDISKYRKTIASFKKMDELKLERFSIADLFPPRRQWCRLKPIEREKYQNSNDLNIECLRRTILTTKLRVEAGLISSPDWFNKLARFIQDIRFKALEDSSYEISLPEIIPERKEIKNGVHICRPLAIYNFTDRIIISLTAKYLTNIFDEFLIDDCCFAFRASKNNIALTHHDTIKAINKYKLENKGDVWVSECDIEKFFDCVNHYIIEKIFIDFTVKCQSVGNPCHHQAKKIFKSYLSSYAFNNNVLLKNDDKPYFLEYGIIEGKFKWPTEKLGIYYSDGVELERIGVPQGGAISCLIANLILHDVDVSVANHGENIRYMRYCDDMIILANSKENCSAALEIYQNKIAEFKLLVHPPNQKKYNKDFWNEKSKLPYLWGKKTQSPYNVPWVSFVGYQIRYDGLIRIRNKSVRKEIKKQKNEIRSVLKSIDSKDKLRLNDNSRKSLRQQIYALESRLISMSVGRMTIRNYKSYIPSFCWVTGFKEVNKNKIIAGQLRRLDRGREHQIYRFKKALKDLSTDTHNPDKVEGTNSFRGIPFSYYNFISTIDG